VSLIAATVAACSTLAGESDWAAAATAWLTAGESEPAETQTAARQHAKRALRSYSAQACGCASAVAVVD